MKIPKLIILSLLLLFMSFKTASACICTGETPTVTQIFNDADVVFSGKIIAKSKFKVLFKVEKFWKGVSNDKISLFNGNTSCESNFAIDGKHWLIYASKVQMFSGLNHITAEIVLKVVPCGRTTELINAQEDIKELGEGKVPVTKARSTKKPNYKKSKKPKIDRKLQTPTKNKDAVSP